VDLNQLGICTLPVRLYSSCTTNDGQNANSNAEPPFFWRFNFKMNLDKLMLKSFRGGRKRSHFPLSDADFHPGRGGAGRVVLELRCGSRARDPSPRSLPKTSSNCCDDLKFPLIRGRQPAYASPHTWVTINVQASPETVVSLASCPGKTGFSL